MAGKGFRKVWSPTTSGGRVSESMSSWTQIVNGSVVLDQIILGAFDSNGEIINISFDFRIVSPSGHNVYISKGNNKVLNDRPNIIMRGIYTFVIENVSQDLQFTGEFVLYDKKDK